MVWFCGAVCTVFDLHAQTNTATGMSQSLAGMFAVCVIPEAPSAKVELSRHFQDLFVCRTREFQQFKVLNAVRGANPVTHNR
jgi:hypothetical protein